MTASNEDILDRLDWIIDRLDILIAVMRDRDRRDGITPSPLPRLSGGSQNMPDDWKPNR